jgi:hypothetical protein
MNGTSRREELVKQLQEKWICELHAKGPESPVYCWVPKDSNYCYPLSTTNLTFWAIQIVSDIYYFVLLVCLRTYCI